MSALLDDIINLAVDGKRPLPDILRKCLLLGHELKNEQLKKWANQELNGYDKPDESLPGYRIVEAEAKGNFAGPFGSGAQNWPIPSLGLEEKHRSFAERVYLSQAVSAFQDVVDQGPGDLMFPWPTNLALRYQKSFFQGKYALVTAWQEVSKSRIVELLDTIRNRTLNMALQIKDELGTSYADIRQIDSSDVEKIQNIVFNNIGGNSNVAFGGSVNASGQTIITLGDRKGLDAALTRVGLDKEDLDDLTVAIKTDGPKPGNRVGKWVKDKSSKVLSGGITVGTKIGSEILTAWIKQHYGL